LVGQHPHEQHRERIDDEEREQEPQRERRRGDDRVAVSAGAVHGEFDGFKNPLGI
jgi:hypothetical protein